MLSAYVERFDRQDPVSALVVGDRPEPAVPDGWAAVEVRAASINHHDIWSLRGVGPAEENLPMILGCDAAGIDDEGREVVVHAVIQESARRGEPAVRSVLSERHQGTFAERVVVPRENLIAKPPELSFAEAACLPTAWLTAYTMLFRQAGVSAGDTVLVQGASGGLSTALIVLGRAAGLRVWVTGRTADKREYASRIGAHEAFPSDARLPERVDAVMDSVGTATWTHSLKALRPEGTLVVAGATSGHVAETHIARVFAHRLRIVGTAMGSADDLRRLLRFCALHKLTPPIHDALPLSRAREAFATVADGEVRGKVVLLP
ncbi:zinc-binding alcohol dehydrogenase family protein [Streptomyces griseorubiginosus]|uniref:quinone oxidoreductase family protein n=1 Tax=Streptomyces griseorubiginosus TaxID=67304 RepID=UPI0036C08246